MFGYQGFDFFLAERSENLDVLGSVIIAHVQPELVELVRRSLVRVEPDVARFGLAELATVGLSDERTSQGKGFATLGTANEFGTGSDVTPLVRTT